MSWYLIKDGKQGEQQNKASIGVVKRAMQCTSDKNPTTIRLRRVNVYRWRGCFSHQVTRKQLTVVPREYRNINWQAVTYWSQLSSHNFKIYQNWFSILKDQGKYLYFLKSPFKIKHKSIGFVRLMTSIFFSLFVITYKSELNRFSKQPQQWKDTTR